MNQKMLGKLDIYNFLYTESASNYDYRVGKSIENDEERYISNIRINPEEDDYKDFIAYCINNAKSVKSRMITIDYRLLDSEMISVLEDAYQKGNITGIKLYPEDSVLTRDLIKKLDIETLEGFMLTANNIENPSSTYLDIRDEKNVCKIEHIIYNNGIEHDDYNIHITRKLTREEISTLASILRKNNYKELRIDFYEPMYYKELLRALKEEKISKALEITFLANPLYDEASIYSGLDKILKNQVIIKYNTCNDLNEYYREFPFTTGANYYSDIEASGTTTPDNYKAMIEMFDEVNKTLEEREYSPLEKVAYIHDYFKKNYVYNYEFNLEGCDENSKLDRVYDRDRMICEGFSNLYSALLRRSGVLCFTYGTDVHQKNIARIKDDKYGIDSIVKIDPTWDLDTPNNRNNFKNFLVPIDDDLYATDAEVINVLTSLVINNGTYSTYIEESNPVYATEPMGYAIRMLELMGLGSTNEQFETEEDKINFYKSALANSHLIERIDDAKIIEAIHHVRVTEHEYTEDFEEQYDLDEIERSIRERGNLHDINPRIRLFSGIDVETRDYIPKEGVHFDEIDNQSVRYHRPRKRLVTETTEEYNEYLENFYHETFYENKTEQRENEEEIEEFRVLEKIRIFRDTTNAERLFAHESIFKRFHAELPKNFIKVPKRENIYELDEILKYILENNKNNSYAPYEIEYEDIDVVMLEEIEKKTSIHNEDLIPGTEYKRPRARGIHETDEEYVDYLEYYYNTIFPDTTPRKEKKSIEDEIAPEKPRPRGIYETDEEYTRYLQDFYGSVPKDELIPGTNYRKPRGREIYETEEEYEAFLEKYYTEIYGEEVVKKSKKK